MRSRTPDEAHPTPGAAEARPCGGWPTLQGVPLRRESDGGGTVQWVRGVNRVHADSGATDMWDTCHRKERVEGAWIGTGWAV